jgi:YHS domain-containing protein
MCPPEFKKDPAKYIKKLEDAGVTLEKTPLPQTTCPVMGGKIDKRYYADYQGKRVYFCCPMCPPEFKKDPAKYVKKLEDAGVTLEKTPTK